MENLKNFTVFMKKDNPLNIRLVGETVCDEKYYIERRCSDLLSLEYIVAGEGTLVINGQTLHPKSGDVFLLTKGSQHKYYPDPQNPWHKYWICFEGPLAEAMVQLYLPKNVYLFENCHIKKMFSTIFDIGFNTSYDYQRITDLITVELLKIFIYLKSNVLTEEPDLAQYVKNMLDKKLTQPFSLDQLAKEMCYSKNHLINIFEKRFQETPYQYYIHKKIELAKDYLKNTSMSIGEISAALCYSDQQYFSTSFKKIVGYSPAAYRKSTIIYNDEET